MKTRNRMMVCCRRAGVAVNRVVLIGLVLAGLVLVCGPARAGVTERACIASDRSPGPGVCACAQKIADRALSQADQQQVARIIADPDLLQIIARKQSPQALGFIQRYRAWGESAERHCR